MYMHGFCTYLHIILHNICMYVCICTYICSKIKSHSSRHVLCVLELIIISCSCVKSTLVTIYMLYPLCTYIRTCVMFISSLFSCDVRRTEYCHGYSHLHKSELFWQCGQFSMQRRIHTNGRSNGHLPGNWRMEY